jgi:hypothetical protein
MYRASDESHKYETSMLREYLRSSSMCKKVASSTADIGRAGDR